jgi:spore maturation protein CgeB
MDLPKNVPHLYPRDRAAFYSRSTATPNLSRDAMHRRGWAPASRLFKAAACGGSWPGLEDTLEPDTEVLLADSRADVLEHLTVCRRAAIGQAAHVLNEHTFARGAEQLEQKLGQWANAY